MPGKKITDHQVLKYKEHRNKMSQVAAAAKTAISDLSTSVLLRRIAQLEATVGRLSEDLGTLRSAVSKQGLKLPRTPGVRARVAHATVPAAHSQNSQATGGLAGATARGEAARVQWVKDGLVVPGEQLAQA